MEKQNGNNKKGLTATLGKATPAKISGLTYSLAPILSLVLAFVFLIVALMADGSADMQEKNWYLYCTYLLSPICFALVAAVVFRWGKLSLKEEVHAQRCAVKYFILAIVLQCGLFCLSQLNSLFLGWLAKFGYEDTPIVLPSMDGIGFVGVLFTVALLPAVFEELIFRGLLLRGMRSFGTVGAVLLNGALFALYHQNPAQTLYQFCCGAAFALMAIRARSILPTILSHFINNALILILTKYELTAFSPAVAVAIAAVSSVCLLGALAWLLFKERDHNFPQGEKVFARVERKSFFVCASVGIAFCVLTWLGVLFSGM